MFIRSFMIYLLFLVWNIWTLLLLNASFILDKLPLLWKRPPLSSFCKDVFPVRLLKFYLLIDILVTYLVASCYLFKILAFNHALFGEKLSSIQKRLDRGERLPFSVFTSRVLFVSAFSQPILKVFDDIGKFRERFPSVALVSEVLPLDKVVRLI